MQHKNEWLEYCSAFGVAAFVFFFFLVPDEGCIRVRGKRKEEGCLVLVHACCWSVRMFGRQTKEEGDFNLPKSGLQLPEKCGQGQ